MRNGNSKVDTSWRKGRSMGHRDTNRRMGGDTMRRSRPGMRGSRMDSSGRKPMRPMNDEPIRPNTPAAPGTPGYPNNPTTPGIPANPPAPGTPTTTPAPRPMKPVTP